MEELFSSVRIITFLKSHAKNIEVEIVEETKSTNTDLLRRINNLQAPTLLLALKQTEGRGRGGKAWHSAFGSSLTFSLAWPFSKSVAELSGLSLAVGCTLAQVFHQIGVPVMLKWPNDILKDGKKLAGILIERTSGFKQSKQQKNWVIIGIGINLQLPNELKMQIDQSAEALWVTDLDKNKFMAILVNQLAEALTLFDKDGLSAFIQMWNDMHAYNGKRVVLFQDGQSMQTGTVVGIDEYGRLILEEQGNKMFFNAGEISLRAENN